MTTEAAITLTIYPDDHKQFGPCSCCGNMTRRIWGYADDHGVTVAAYFVEWTPGHVAQIANFDLIIGKWGEETELSDRSAVALAFRWIESSPSFMVIDASDREFSKSSLVGKIVSRTEVLDSSLRSQVFEICDAIYLKDPRISELTDSI
jgi:hypothetical protein